MTTSDITASLERYLACPCQFFPPMQEDAPILSAYRDARARGAREGFLPMLLVASDTLLESLFFNVDETWSGGELDPARVRACREKLLAAPLRDGDAAARELMDACKANAEEYGFSWGDIGEIAGGDKLDRFLGYWDYTSRRTSPVLLAELPVKRPWEVFAYLPFGGWNECPDTVVQMEMAKYWFERYGAVPALMTADVLEYTLPAPIPAEDAAKTALEQYAFCADIVDQGVGSIGALADGLRKSTNWYFWWD